ncbi:MAG: hypothetical protein AAF191_06330 [Verrucomicrobiota bacterium]
MERAFTAETLDEDLTAQTRAFLNDHPEGVEVSENGKQASISMLFSWFASDFGDARTFINQYRDEPLGEKVAIDFLEYHWERNDR